MALLREKHKWIKLPPALTIDYELTLREQKIEVMLLTIKVSKLCPLRTFMINDVSFVDARLEDKTVKFFEDVVTEFLHKGIDDVNELNIDKMRMGVIIRDFSSFADKLSHAMIRFMSIRKKINGGLKYDLEDRYDKSYKENKDQQY